MVTISEIFCCDGAGLTPSTLCHIFTSHLQVNTACNRSFAFVNFEKLLHFPENILEISGFKTGRTLFNIPMHRVTAPDYILAL